MFYFFRFREQNADNRQQRSYKTFIFPFSIPLILFTLDKLFKKHFPQCNSDIFIKCKLYRSRLRNCKGPCDANFFICPCLQGPSVRSLKCITMQTIHTVCVNTFVYVHPMHSIINKSMTPLSLLGTVNAHIFQTQCPILLHRLSVIICSLQNLMTSAGLTKLPRATKHIQHTIVFTVWVGALVVLPMTTKIYV